MDEDFFSVLKPYFENFTPVIAPKIPQTDYLAIDLSVNNRTLNQLNLDNSIEIERYINGLLTSNNKKIAYGGYLEKRLLYKRSKLFSDGVDTKKLRNIHLGIDFWFKKGTAVVCPFDGEVHSYKNNTKYGDYGPTIILKHTINNYKWYTLYGHLSKKSLEKINIGDKIKKGDVFGFLGNREENGNYAPHLHFQIIKSLAGKMGDYPGVCSEIDKAFYTKNCLNPVPLLFT